MTDGAVASETTATAPRERGWRWFVLALVVVVAVTAIPYWPPTLALVGAVVRLLLPVEQFGLLALLGLAACSIVGWWAGGRLVAAVFWIAVSGLVLWKLSLPFSGYGSFVRGFSMSLGAAFGLVCLTTGSRPFLGRALAAVALAAMVSLGGLVVRTPSGSGAFQQSVSMLDADYANRLDESMAQWKRRTDSPIWDAFAARFPDAASRADRAATTIAQLGGASDTGFENVSSNGAGRIVLARLAPALLALESLLALAVGWVTYHRLARTRIGPPMAALRDIRFNDQLVWGLVVGGVILILPTLADWQLAGINLVFFFGALYAARGLGVLLWWIPDRVAVVLLLALVLLIPVLGPIRVLTTLVAMMFGLGLVDTWRDFRAGQRERRPTLHP